MKSLDANIIYASRAIDSGRFWVFSQYLWIWFPAKCIFIFYPFAFDWYHRRKNSHKEISDDWPSGARISSVLPGFRSFCQPKRSGATKSPEKSAQPRRNEVERSGTEFRRGWAGFSGDFVAPRSRGAAKWTESWKNARDPGEAGQSSEISRDLFFSRMEEILPDFGDSIPFVLHRDSDRFASIFVALECSKRNFIADFSLR